MYVIVGRGGILNVLFGLFVMALYAMYKVIVLFLAICAVGVITLAITIKALAVIIKHLWDRHQHRKFVKRARTRRQEIIHDHQAKSAGPRDWTPPE